MPGARIFVDSNTFLYTFAEFEKEKSLVAQGWLNWLSIDDRGVTNLQVLNEVANAATRKTTQFGGIDPFFRIDAFAQFGTHTVSFKTTLGARQLHRRRRYSWWDCLLLATAIELGCSHFLSEDLQDGHKIEGLTIVDPFAHTPKQFLSAH